ncbi:MAG: hypothetical protein IKR26_00305 [Lachnospiraceae bacterium]|nr:hypothetical protein [Lachnospiraceae bacterium]
MKIKITGNASDACKELLKKHISKRIDASFEVGGLEIRLATDEALGKPESYSIAGDGDMWTVTGSDEKGLYYGIGKLLHSAVWTEDEFFPKPTDGVISPDCDFRCIYFSVHAFNWYFMAPTEDLEEYLEEMILYGYNALHTIVPVFNIHQLDDDVFKESVKKNRAIFAAAKKVGLKTVFGVNPNQGLLSAPHEFDADLSYDTSDVGRYRGWAGRNLCPNKPGATEYLRNIWLKCLEQFTDIGIDYVITWPYDEGGCGCEKCAPWGAGGFDKLSRLLAQDVRELYPAAKFIYSTWTFDVPGDQKEYSTLYKRLEAGEMDYVDYLMTDAHGAYPKFVLEHPLVRPIVSFPEISMWGLFPWGGYGANPLPKRFEEIWDSAKGVLSGGDPYSEGLYEDISKIQFIGYFWNKNARYKDILREYASYEFGEDVADDAVRIMELIEVNHVGVYAAQQRCLENGGPAKEGDPISPDMPAAQEAYDLVMAADSRMSELRKNSWRWRILYIRTVLDYKRYKAFFDRGMRQCYEDFHILRHDDEENQVLKNDAGAQALYQELRDIYHCLDHDNGRNKWTLPVVQGACHIK